MGHKDFKEIFIRSHQNSNNLLKGVHLKTLSMLTANIKYFISFKYNHDFFSETSSQHLIVLLSPQN